MFLQCGRDWRYAVHSLRGKRKIMWSTLKVKSPYRRSLSLIYLQGGYFWVFIHLFFHLILIADIKIRNNMGKIPTIHVTVVSVIPVFPFCLWIVFHNHLCQNHFDPKSKCWIFPGFSITFFPFILFVSLLLSPMDMNSFSVYYGDGFQVPIFNLLPLWTQDLVYVHFGCTWMLFKYLKLNILKMDEANDLLSVFPYSAYCRADRPTAPARTLRATLSTSLTTCIHETTKPTEF